MMTAPVPTPPDKFARYRGRKRALGLRQVRLWVPDVRAPGFREQVAREVASLDQDDETEVLEWIEALQADLDWPDYDWGPEGPPGTDERT